MKNVAAFALLLVAASASTALSATTPHAVPATNDYIMETRPMIVGTVASMNDYQMVVNTDEGRQLTLALDTRTMRPVDLMPGMVVRTEFKVLDNGDQYAQRIVPLRGEELDAWRERTAYRRTQTFETETATIETAEPTTSDKDAYSSGRATTPAAREDEIERNETRTTETGDVDNAADAREDAHGVLPQTASNQPLLALLGLLALGSAGAFWFRRARHA